MKPIVNFVHEFYAKCNRTAGSYFDAAVKLTHHSFGITSDLSRPDLSLRRAALKF
jgi:hypothetical protein